MNDEFRSNDGLLVSDPGPASREAENRVNEDGQPRVPGNLSHGTGNVSSNQPEIFTNEDLPLSDEEKRKIESGEFSDRDRVARTGETTQEEKDRIDAQGTPRGMAVNEGTRTPLGVQDSQSALDMNRGLATNKTIPEGTLEEAVRNDKAVELDKYKEMLDEANKALGNAKIGEISLTHAYWGLSDKARQFAKDQGILK